MAAAKGAAASAVAAANQQQKLKEQQRQALAQQQLQQQRKTQPQLQMAKPQLAPVPKPTGLDPVAILKERENRYVLPHICLFQKTLLGRMEVARPK